jgi:hypothetical protein
MRKRSVLLAGVLTLGVVLALPIGLTFAASNSGPAAPVPTLTLPSLPIPRPVHRPGVLGVPEHGAALDRAIRRQRHPDVPAIAAGAPSLGVPDVLP